MAGRPRGLDDTAPDGWQLGGSRDRLDVLIMLYARDEATRDTMLADRSLANRILLRMVG